MNKTSNKQYSDKSYSTIISAFLFMIGNLILSSLSAWMILIFWFIFTTDSSFKSVIINTTKLIWARLHLFIHYIPFITVIFVIFIIDGLVQRDIRKFQCARESAFIFHRLKPLASQMCCVTFFCYMCVPINISSEYFFVPMACLSGLFIKLSVENFKKYV